MYAFKTRNKIFIVAELYEYKKIISVTFVVRLKLKTRYN